MSLWPKIWSSPINMAPSQKGFQKGQISILFIFSLLISFTVLAFVVNIGLYVKAKINLQNAVDAAAWSGAAVQARQLSSIAYLNWEMRNTYKEWMFKYYVLGNLSAPKVKTLAPSSSSGQGVDFRMEDRNPSGNSQQSFLNDRYNVPSICIDFARTAQLCRMAEIPGLPQFNSTSITQIDYVSDEFSKAINELKGEDCVKRSELNYFVARAWAFGIDSGPGASASASAKERAAKIATDRPGAWPTAVELAMRVRGLEHIINTEPFAGGVCGRPGSSSINCSRDIGSLVGAQAPHFERTIKAFYSAYRNLGNNVDSEMKNSFTLTELAPRNANFPVKYGLSRYLTPDSATGVRDKPYIDLKLALLNLVTFYTHFSPGTGNSGGTRENAACQATKTALPVPGYPFGFDKNPNVLTYYAVKGEAEFVGLFNPFQNATTKLTAYAAAKPYGGRIG